MKVIKKDNGWPKADLVYKLSKDDKQVELVGLRIRDLKIKTSAIRDMKIFGYCSCSTGDKLKFNSLVDIGDGEIVTPSGNIISKATLTSKERFEEIKKGLRRISHDGYAIINVSIRVQSKDLKIKRLKEKKPPKLEI